MIQLISTSLDVQSLFRQIWDDEDDMYKTVSLFEVRNAIIQADGEIRSTLKDKYSSALTVIPWVSVPQPKISTVTSRRILLSNGTEEMTASVPAISQLWTITFITAVRLLLDSDVYGAQGDFDITINDVIAPNKGLAIPKELFVGTFVIDDVFFIRTYNYPPLLVKISSLLAASSLLSGIYNSEVEGGSVHASRYEATARKLLKQINSGDISIEGLSETVNNLNPIQVDYEIDQFGRDQTNYNDAEWSKT